MVKRHKNTIGVWRLGKTLGTGSTSCVRLAKHAKTGDLAAIKIIPIRYASIGMEILMMRLLRHPNILRLYDVWTDHQHMYLALEYVPDGELFHYIRKHGPLSEREAAHYLSQILDAVAHCHRFRFRHRDLKLENILIKVNEQQIKIADFGMATVEPNDSCLENYCGSLHYLAPEIVSHKPYRGAPADVWSCGVILYSLLSNKLPFGGQNTDVIYNKIRHGAYDLPSSISSAAQDLLHRMLDVNPSTRITIPEFFSHPFLMGCTSLSSMDSTTPPTPSLSIDEIDPLVVDCMCVLWKKSSSKKVVRRLQQRDDNDEKYVYKVLSEILRDDMLKKQRFDENKYLSLYDLIHDNNLFTKASISTTSLVKSNVSTNSRKSSNFEDELARRVSSPLSALNQMSQSPIPIRVSSDKDYDSYACHEVVSNPSTLDDDYNYMFVCPPEEYTYSTDNVRTDSLDLQSLPTPTLEQLESVPFNRYGYVRIFPSTTLSSTASGYYTPDSLSTPEPSIDGLTNLDDVQVGGFVQGSGNQNRRPISFPVISNMQPNITNVRSASAPLCSSPVPSRRYSQYATNIRYTPRKVSSGSVLRKISSFFRKD
nr:putative protein kinase [Schizosaccharomyces pombe]